MEALIPGKHVSYTAADGTEHPAVVLDDYGGQALVNVPDLRLPAVEGRLQFERQYQAPP